MGRRLRHPAFEPSPGGRSLPLADAELTDRWRVAVLLQGAALLAHLEHAGRRLAGGWEGARVDGEGRLRLGEVAPGRDRRLPQEAISELAAELFGGGGPVAGRGEARRAARVLLGRWRQTLAPISADELVGQLLDTAPFLWDDDLGPARTALAAEHRRGGASHLWVAGPGPFRTRLLAAAADRGGLVELLGGPSAVRLWAGDEPGDPERLAAAGRWRAAVASWSLRPPSTAGERMELALAWYALGRFERALAAAAGLAGAEAAVLRTWCQLSLGRLGAARRSLRRLDPDELAPAERIAAAEVAVRVLANAAAPRRAARWVERALESAAGADPVAAGRARLLAAGAAWDRGDAGEAQRLLDASRDLAADPEHGWRWLQIEALTALAAGDGDAARASLRRALAGHRRRLRRFEAAALWNDLGVARGQAGLLAAAERAFLHALRLYRGCDGPRETTLALVNLAEIRLRRGRPRGVREILERSAGENRATGNVRGVAYDSALWTRWELLHGRPEAALVVCREALDELDRHAVEGHRDELRLLAARALGWLGRSDEAAAELGAVGDGALGALEPEERPALLALAGDREAALGAAAGAPAASLWRRLLLGEAAPATDWDELTPLEPFRAARAVYDAELIAPGSAPAHWRRRAVAVFRRLGAGPAAGRLEARDTGAWGALAAYLARQPGEPGAMATLLADAGYGEVRLWWESERDARVLVDGAGGAERLAAPAAGGTLVLTAPWTDDVLRAVFRVALRDLGEADGAPASSPGETLGRADGIVGSSPVLRAALERLDLLAPGELPLFIHGESGTGKELAARRVHRLSARREQPFVAINCAALSESLLLSDLFGHVRGAFTGAERDRAGVFETAAGGTVFLDEIGDLPANAQGMLLRVLQEGEVRRVGESLPRRVDVRVVAASHRDLEAMAAEGAFRQDLYYRLCAAAVPLPPLRERGGDAVEIAEHLLARRAPPGGGAPPRLAPAARERIAAHRWPGNVRELENVLGVAAALAAGGVVGPEHLELPAVAEVPSGDYHRQVESLRRRLVEEALAAAGGNRAEAARRLGLSRQALSYLVRKLRIG